MEVTGRGAVDAFCREPGGHRWQRVPPTEKRGRRQSSTVTVAVLLPTSHGGASLDPREVEFSAHRGSGPGGQHQNTTESAIRATHRPTGLSVSVQGRSQTRNKEAALRVLAERVRELRDSTQSAERSKHRKAQVGSGMRADKVRTVAEQRGRVEDHRSGKRISIAHYLRGELERLA